MHADAICRHYKSTSLFLSLIMMTEVNEQLQRLEKHNPPTVSRMVTWW
jgi:hypothetical protein